MARTPSKTKTPTKPIGKKAQAVANEETYMPPMIVGQALANDYDNSNSTRKRGSTINQDWFGLGNLQNIRAGLNPFHNGGTTFDVKEAILLCQKAYWNFPLLKNTIDVMTELTNSRIYLKGGNQKTRDLIGKWFDKIGLWGFKEEFFREWYRSGNVIVYRINGELQPNDLIKMTQVYGSMNSTTIPIRYIILNPADIRVGANVTFMEPLYYKVLSNYEIERLRYPKTDEDKQVLKALGPNAINEIKSGVNPFLKLNPLDLTAVFYKKQPYEPMAVPFAYPLLDDINAKMELKRLDMKVARMTDRALLLITAGDEPKKGGINPKTLASLQSLFSNDSLSRTLVADYTVKGDWLIPDIGKILGPEKYVQIDKDIAAGLNAILFSNSTDEKFANTSVKIQIFIERLKEARNAFLQKFLQPEIIEICQSINAKVYPEAVFEDINLRDDLQWAKIYTQLAQLGILTPTELLDALDTGKLPMAADNVTNQAAYKDLREKGYYLPLVGASIQDPEIGAGAPQIGTPAGNGAGRPSGSKAPQSSKTVSPIGSGSSKASKFSAVTLKDMTTAADELKSEISKRLKKKFKIKTLDETQESIANLITTSIMANEDGQKWNESIASYIKEPKEIPKEIADEIDEICVEHNVDSYIGSILRLSKI